MLAGKQESFIDGQTAEYYSMDEKQWLDCIVVCTDTDGGVHVTVNGHERTVPQEELATRLKQKAATERVSEEAQEGFIDGQTALYLSMSEKKWRDCIVIRTDADGGVHVTVNGHERTVPKGELATRLKEKRTCAKAGCKEAANGDSAYCSIEHFTSETSAPALPAGKKTCAREGCNEPVSGTSLYCCIEHVVDQEAAIGPLCRYPGCQEAASGRSLFCSPSHVQPLCKAPGCQEIASYTSTACGPHHIICDRKGCQRTGCPSWDGRQRNYCSWAHEQEAAELDQPAFKPRSDVFLASVQVVPFGVLGHRLSSSRDSQKGYADPPDAAVAFVDPAGLPYIQEAGPGGAGGASGAAYSFLEIDGDPAFPPEVKAAIRNTGDAKFHAYPKASCIHVVGPNFGVDEEFRDLDSFQDADRTKAVSELAKAYRNIFAELSNSKLRTLRLLPVSGSIFAGQFQQQMHQITPLAIQEGFLLLTDEDQRRVRSCTIQLCIFEEQPYTEYKSALKRVSGLIAMA